MNENFTIYNASGEAVYTIEQNKIVEVSADSSPIVEAIASADSSADSSMTNNILSSISDNTYNISMGLLLLFSLYIILHELRWWR